jgi:hypothetical protein
MASPGVLTPAFPPPFPDGVKSLRIFETDEATADFGDRQFAFERVDPKDPAEPEQGWARTIRVTAIDEETEYSFDGTTVHGRVPAAESREIRNTYEGGIAVRGSGAGVSTPIAAEDPGTTPRSTINPVDDGIEVTFTIGFAHIPIDTTAIVFDWDLAAVPKTATLTGTSTVGGADAAEIVSAVVNRASGQLVIEFVTAPDADTLRLSYDYLYHGTFYIEAW